MNSLIKLDGILTMSSVEIAELTGKRHDNVMRDISKMLDELRGLSKDEANFRSVGKMLDKLRGVLSFEDTYINPQNGQSYPCFNLPKRETLILVSGYSVAMRAKIIDRWQELEKQTITLPNFLDPAESAIAWANEYRAKRLAFATIEQQKPAVEFVDQYVKTDSSKTISEVAKLLKAGPKMFFAWLDIEGIIFKRGNTWLPKAKYVKYFDVKTGLTLSKNPKNFNQTRFKPEGIVWIAKRWDKFNKQGKLL